MGTGARAVGTVLQNALNPTFSEIDNDSSITKVTLTVKNDTLTPKYSHSKTKQKSNIISLSEKSDKEVESDDYFFEYVNTPAEVFNYTNHLMQFTKNLSPEESFTLYYFLLTCIQYISDFQPLADHKLSSLAKLADVTHIPKELGYDDPAFDRIRLQ